MFKHFLKKLIKFFKFIYSNIPASWWNQMFVTSDKKVSNKATKKKFECKPLEELFLSISQGNWKPIYNRDSYISIWADLKKKWFK